MAAKQSYFEFVGHDFEPKSRSLQFHYTLQTPDNKQYHFTETLILPERDLSLSRIPTQVLKATFDGLLLVLGISYWKTYCPGDVRLKSLQLTKEQAQFWNSVYTKGLGEFFYKNKQSLLLRNKQSLLLRNKQSLLLRNKQSLLLRNKIDFRRLVSFPYSNTQVKAVSFPRQDRSLLPLGGGKDSIVSGELLKSAGKQFSAFTLGTHPIQQQVAQVMGVDQLCVERKLDAKLFELNKRSEVFNGHVPISAIYHFVGLLLALLYDYRYLVFSNEASSDYGNVEYLGEKINHQWSKSFEFEKMFQDYVKEFITPDVTAFSLLRPIHEIKIAKLFSKYKEYFSVFSSCNRNFTIQKSQSLRFCSECRKCAFVFVSLAAFLPKEKVVEIFGQNLLAKEPTTAIFAELLGLRDVKPFECVGTPEETQLAFYLSFKTNNYNNDSIMKLFLDKFSNNFSQIESQKNLFLGVSDNHQIPDEFKAIIGLLK